MPGLLKGGLKLVRGRINNDVSVYLFVIYNIMETTGQNVELRCHLCVISHVTSGFVLELYTDGFHPIMDGIPCDRVCSILDHAANSI